MAVRVKKGKGILFEAVPDSGRVNVKVGDNGRPQIVWPNRIVLPADIMTKVRNDTVPFVYPPPKPIEYTGASWIVNVCADADEYHDGLISLDQAFGQKLPIFNHPRAVAMTRRDLSSKLLDGIPNLIVPKCVRFKADSSNSFQKTFEAEGFSYPVLIRPAGSQTGRDLVKIDTPFDWPKVYQTHWYSKHHYMTQFVDFGNRDGKYVRRRVAFVGREVFLRGYTENDGWYIKLAYGQNAGARELHTFVEKANEFGSAETLQEISRQVIDRGRLDFWGMDVGDLGDGRYVLFEANPAMSILDVHGVAKDDYAIIKDKIDIIKSSVSALLKDTSRWMERFDTTVSEILDGKAR